MIENGQKEDTLQFTSFFINVHLLILCKSNEFLEDISQYSGIMRNEKLLALFFPKDAKSDFSGNLSLLLNNEKFSCLSEMDIYKEFYSFIMKEWKTYSEKVV